MAKVLKKVKGIKRMVEEDEVVSTKVEVVKGTESVKPSPSCFLVLFKIEGHETYRTAIWKTPADFYKYLAQEGQKNHPVPIDRKWFVIDKITGTIKEV